MINVFDRNKVSQKRNRIIPSFDKNPYFLHDWAFERMSERLSFIKKDFGSCLQIGTRGKNLKSKKNYDFYFITDVTKNLKDIHLVCDEEFLPFKDHSFDLIQSSLNLHSVNDLPGAMLQIKQCLKPDGLFLAAILGGETLMELRDCLAQAELELSGGITPRVFPFADKQQIGGLLQRAGFALPVVDSDIVTVTHETMFDLMHDLRAMGETNIISTRKKNFTTRALFYRAAEIYTQKYIEKDGRIKASFEIIFMAGWSPHESQQKPLKPGSATSRLSDALGTNEMPANDIAGI